MHDNYNDIKRFWSKTAEVAGCIVWTAGVDKDGYGKFATGGRGKVKHFRAHRWIAVVDRARAKGEQR